MGNLKVVPVTLKEANEFVGKVHRHHKATVGHKFSIGVEKDGQLVGVCVTGRPVARKIDHTRVAEVTRLATDGTKNACSILYAAAARCAKAMGYDKIQTYILETEPGITLKAAGWEFETYTTGGAWKHTAGPRNNNFPLCRKARWGKKLNG
jgi:hypothetical protein